MGDWEQYHIEERLIGIMREVFYEKPDVMGQCPYFTPYQLAIYFAQRYPEDLQTMGRLIGGAGAGRQDTLANYIAKQLAQLVRADRTHPIEGAWLSMDHLYDMLFKNGRDEIHASVNRTYALSLFRLRFERDE